MNDLILKEVARFLFPFIELYGFYIVFHGHLSPGGGFAGGVVCGAGFILYTLAHGHKALYSLLPRHIWTFCESAGLAFFIFLGLVGIFVGREFLANSSAGFPLGRTGELFSSGLVFLLNLAIGLKVASTVTTLFLNLEEED
ncbi:MAG: sodium:proton antiporter [Firmicutes bacterium]|nr:sodium:proton antiporter [Bacillota bacterium]